MIKIKMLAMNLSALTTLPISMCSCLAKNEDKKANKYEKNEINMFNDNKEIKKYIINFDNKEMVFDSKKEIISYLINMIKIDRFLGKYEYKDYDGRININPEMFNYFDVSKLKSAYKDIYGNYTDDKEAVIRSYLPEFAIVKRYYDHTNKSFKNQKDAIDSILENSTNSLVDNLFYTFDYIKNGEKEIRYYNPYNKNDINQLMADISQGKILYNGETHQNECLLLEWENQKRIFSYKGKVINFYENLFNELVKEFIDLATNKKNYKISLSLDRMDKYSYYKNYGQGYFENISSIEGEEDWQENNENHTIYKYVDENWIKQYFDNFDAFQNNYISKKFVKNNFNTHYQKKITTYDNEDYQKELEKYKKSSNPRKRPPNKTITKVHYDHFANLKGKFLDFKTLTLSAKNFKKDSEYVTVFSYDKYTYNNFGLKITVEFDNDEFKNKIQTFKNNFTKNNQYLMSFTKIIESVLNKLIPENEKIYAFESFNNLKNDKIFLKMLWCIFDKWLVDFINLEKINTDYFSLKFDDYFESCYKNMSSMEWSNKVINFDRKSAFYNLELKDFRDWVKDITYYGDQPIFYKEKENYLINLTNKQIINNKHWTLINPDEIDKELISKKNLIETKKLIVSHKNFADKRQISFDDDYLENILYLDGVKLQKFLNFIKYNDGNEVNNHYIFNNSYMHEKTFKNETEIANYLNIMKLSGILPESKYIIVGLESTLKANGIKLLTEELRFNSPDIILNNPEAILQKLILPSTKKIFYLHKGEKYLLDIKYFNLWNIKINNEIYFFDNPAHITSFIEKYVSLNSKEENFKRSN